MAKKVEPSRSMAELFGKRVTRLRERASLTQAQLAQMIYVERTRIVQVENASGSRPSLALAQALDDALKADNLLVDLWPYVYRESFPDWSRRFIELSERAVIIREYAAHAVPGLLQTEAYARAVLRIGRSLTSTAQLEERLTLRMERQARLSAPDRPDLHVVLDESVLRRPVGGPTVMRAQLERLYRATEEHAVQLAPFESGEHPLMGGSLTLLTLPNGDEVAYTEGADYGQLIEDPTEVRTFIKTYDQIRALSLPYVATAREINTAAKGSTDRDQLSGARALAKKQLQQSRGRKLRGSPKRDPSRHPRP